MRLPIRLVAAVLALAAGTASAAPVPAPGKFDPPTVVGQAASVQRLLDEFFTLVKGVTPAEAERMQKAVAEKLGEKGWAGLDEKKPLGAFAYLKPKLANSYAVVVLPITKEKDALDLFDRLGLAVEADDKNKGLYKVKGFGVLTDDHPGRLRFHDGHAYLGVNADPDEMAADKLLPANAVIDPNDKAPLAATLHLGRAPAELKEMLDGWWAGAEGSLTQLENNPPATMPKSWPALGKAVMGWTKANTAALFKEGETFAVRVKVEPKTADFAFEFTVTPKAKSPLAADIAAVKAVPARFHQLVTKGAVGGAWLAVGPGLNKEVRAKAGPMAADLLAMLGRSGGEHIEPVTTELGRMADAALTDGKLDLGFALLGPDKEKAHTGILAMAADPTGLEKAVRKMVADLPKEAQEMAKLDAEKAGELNVHVLTLPEGTEWVEKVFGKKAAVRLAFGKDAVYVAVGPDGLTEIKRAAALKPADGKRMDFVVNPDKLTTLIADLSGQQPGADGAGMWSMMFGKGDSLRSQWGVDVKGGKELTVTYTQNGIGMLGLFFFGASVRQ